MKMINRFKTLTITTSWFWLLIFTLLPAGLLFMSIMTFDTSTIFTPTPTLQNFSEILNIAYLRIFLRSITMSSIATFICLLIAYPFSYIISQTHERLKNLLLLLVIIPFWTSSLIRAYAIMAILKTKGILNTWLLKIGLIHTPLQLLYTDTALFIGLVYTLLPFMILPLYANMQRLDHSQLEAARDLGANRITVFRKVLIPMTMPGILSGIILVFFPAMTLFYIPTLLGGAKNMLLGNLIQSQFLVANNWPQGAATSIFLMLIMILCLSYYWRHTDRKDRENLL